MPPIPKQFTAIVSLSFCVGTSTVAQSKQVVTTCDFDPEDFDSDGTQIIAKEEKASRLAAKATDWFERYYNLNESQPDRKVTDEQKATLVSSFVDPADIKDI